MKSRIAIILAPALALASACVKKEAGTATRSDASQVEGPKGGSSKLALLLVDYDLKQPGGSSWFSMVSHDTANMLKTLRMDGYTVVGFPTGAGTHKVMTVEKILKAIVPPATRDFDSGSSLLLYLTAHGLAVEEESDGSGKKPIEYGGACFRDSEGRLDIFAPEFFLDSFDGSFRTPYRRLSMVIDTCHSGYWQMQAEKYVKRKGGLGKAKELVLYASAQTAQLSSGGSKGSVFTFTLSQHWQDAIRKSLAGAPKNIADTWRGVQDDMLAFNKRNNRTESNMQVGSIYMEPISMKAEPFVTDPTARTRADECCSVDVMYLRDEAPSPSCNEQMEGFLARSPAPIHRDVGKFRRFSFETTAAFQDFFENTKACAVSGKYLIVGSDDKARADELVTAVSGLVP